MNVRLKYAMAVNPDILIGFSLLEPEEDPRVHIRVVRYCPICGKAQDAHSRWAGARDGDLCARCHMARYHERYPRRKAK